MNYVIDASSAFKWVVAETDSEKAKRIRTALLAGVHELLAPDIFPAKIANSLSMSQRRGRLTDFRPLLFDVLSSCPQLHETPPLLSRVAGIIASVTSGASVSIYDV